MLNVHKTPPGFLDPITRVVEAAPNAADGLNQDDVMVVGAWCRDILRSGLGHTFATAATRDLDLALALSSWDAYRALTTTYPRVGDTGIRFRIADADVDLLPFGDMGDPQGIVNPPSRGETLSVSAFEEIFAGALTLSLSHTVTICLPTVAGLRCHEDWRMARPLRLAGDKDAADLALILHWYAESADVHDRL